MSRYVAKATIAQRRS